MQARVSGPSHHQLYAPSTPTPPKGSLSWDLDDWKWDGDLFLATPTLNMDIVPPDGQQLFPLAPPPPPPQPPPPPPPPPRGGGDSSNASTSCSEEATFLDSNNNNNNKGKGVCDKRRRVIVLDVEDDVADEAASLTLKLGGHHPSATTAAAVSSREGVQHPGPRALCQVQNCGADLSNAKDYHRRHKVCAMHAKASNAMVGNVVQRFCQQCSRYFLALFFLSEPSTNSVTSFHAAVII